MPEDFFLTGFFISTGISSYLLWRIGKCLNRKNHRRLFDQKTNEEVILKDNHSLFFVKMEDCGRILGIISLLLYFAALLE